MPAIERKRFWTTLDSDDDEDDIVRHPKLPRTASPAVDRTAASVSALPRTAATVSELHSTAANVSELQRTASHVFDAVHDSPDRIAAHYATHGFVVVRALTAEECVANIKAQVSGILLKQPWKQRLVVQDIWRALDIEYETERYVNALTRSKLDKETLAHYEAVWPFHSGFGACCDHAAFHMPEMWRIRENPELYAIARHLMGGRRDLWVDINRCIQKLPGKGDEEFLHWDLDFLHNEHRADSAVSGKVMFTDGVFVCVPGTATAAFQAEFKRLYQPLYPNAKAGAAKFALDKAKPDPLDLVAKKVAVKVPAGCAVFWSEWLLHGVQKNPRDGHIQFGMYLGYFPAGSRKEYERKAKVVELQDRIDSFSRGTAPQLWPSFDRIHYYPARYVNFDRLLKPYIDKTRSGYRGLTTRTIKTGARKG
jgi:hypothetical protein